MADTEAVGGYEVEPETFPTFLKLNTSWEAL